MNLAGAEMRAFPEGRAPRPIGRIQVKSRDTTLGVYTTVSDRYGPDEVDPRMAAIQTLERGAHDEAGRALAALAERDDDLSRHQYQRCQQRAGPRLTLMQR